MSRFSQAIRSFLGLLFGGELPADIAAALGLVKRVVKEPSPPAPQASASDGAAQVLSILQRDARLVDFLMEDISTYSDNQVGAAVRGVHEQCRLSLARYVRLAPVIDGVEGSYTKLDASAADPWRVKLLGNVPAGGPPPGGTLRHKGWRAEKVELPPFDARRDARIIAPAEIEVE